VTFALGVDDVFSEVFLLLGPLLLHAASGIANITTAAAILLDLRICSLRFGETTGDDAPHGVTKTACTCGIYDS
jgi:hypothetical protein